MAVITCPHCGNTTSNAHGVCLLCDKMLFAKPPQSPPRPAGLPNKNLIACKDCGSQISKQAKNCPQCGAPAPKQTGACATIVAGLFLVGVIVMVASSTMTPSRTPEQQAQQRVHDDAVQKEAVEAAEAFDIAKRIVTEHLKAPSTAKFPSYPWNANEISIKKYPNNIFSVESHVDSQNGFGAMIRSKWTCFFSNDGKTVEGKFVQIGEQVIGKIPLDEIKSAQPKESK